MNVLTSRSMRLCCRPHLTTNRADRAGAQFYGRKLASTTTTNHLPFPHSAKPSPHEIFHLKPGASETEIKERYYELVRLYHPDSPNCRALQPDDSIRHSQFRAISAAYNSLRNNAGSAADAVVDEQALRRAHERRKAVERLYTNKSLDERWKDRLIFGALLFSLVIIAYQTANTRRQAMMEELSRIKKQNRRIVDSTDYNLLEEKK